MTELFSAALDKLAGAAVVLDDALRVVAITPSADKLLGGHVQLGAHAVKLLCGHDAGRPLAEALAAGRPSVTTVERFRPTSAAAHIRVCATPLLRRERRLGWIIALAEEARSDGDAPELFHAMWSRDPSMRRLFRMAERVAPLDVSVLLEGEMGTGKASLAMAIHALSSRRAEPFTTLSAASTTCAMLDRRAAEGGTLFLDDVTELPLDVQAELLRLLENVLMHANVRIMGSTHVPLHDAVSHGQFRADLGYRLRIVSLHLPPLRARQGDVPLLMERFIDELNARGGRKVEQVDRAARARFEHYDWPGNVRELRSVIESAFVVGEGTTLTAGDLPAEVAAPFVPRGEGAGPSHPKRPMEGGEGETIRRALERTGSDHVRAAALLGMSRTTLWRRMRALGLVTSRRSSSP
jgi:DNA-binding NtrC family response regulator